MCYILTRFRTLIKLFANLQQIEYNSIKQLISVHMLLQAQMKAKHDMFCKKRTVFLPRH